MLFHISIRLDHSLVHGVKMQVTVASWDYNICVSKHPLEFVSPWPKLWDIAVVTFSWATVSPKKLLNVNGRVGQPQTLIAQTRYNKFICYKSSTTNCLRYVAFSCYTYTGQVRSRQESMDFKFSTHPTSGTCVHVQYNDVVFTTVMSCACAHSSSRSPL